MPLPHPASALALGLLTLIGGASTARGQPAVTRTALLRELERLTDGMMFVSERDAPLTVLAWARPGGQPTAGELAALVGERHPELAEPLTVEHFFRAAMRVWPGQSPEERAEANRYVALVRFLRSRLTDVRVFRFGHLTMRVYVVGVAPNGDWMGVATTQTQT